MVLIVLCVAVFVWGLGLPYPLLAGFCERWSCSANLIFGFAVAVTLQNLLYCFIGVFVGTLIGVLPGSARSPPSRCCCR